MTKAMLKDTLERMKKAEQSDVRELGGSNKPGLIPSPLREPLLVEIKFEIYERIKIRIKGECVSHPKLFRAFALSGGSANDLHDAWKEIVLLEM